MLNRHSASGKYVLFNGLVNDYHWRDSNSIRCKRCHSPLSLSCRYGDASLIHTDWLSVLCKLMQYDNIWRKLKAVHYQFNISNLSFQLIRSKRKDKLNHDSSMGHSKEIKFTLCSYQFQLHYVPLCPPWEAHDKYKLMSVKCLSYKERK